MTAARTSGTPPVDSLRLILLEYVRWAQQHPHRFALAYAWTTAETPELERAASASWRQVVGATAEAQAAGVLPPGDPERMAAFVRALAHSAVELAITGHLAPDGKGHASAEDLIGDLFLLLSR